MWLGLYLWMMVGSAEDAVGHLEHLVAPRPAVPSGSSCSANASHLTLAFTPMLHVTILWREWQEFSFGSAFSRSDGTSIGGEVERSLH